MQLGVQLGEEWGSQPGGVSGLALRLQLEQLHGAHAAQQQRLVLVAHEDHLERLHVHARACAHCKGQRRTRHAGSRSGGACLQD